MLWHLLIAFALLAMLLVVLRIIYRPPSLDGRRSSRAIAPDDDCTLVQRLGDVPRRNKGLSGIHVIDDGHEAFAARRGLMRMAERSIDVQYYMWHADLTGRMLMGELLEAADRGVRVRLLLDDNTTAGTDDMLLAASDHPKIEVRLFNPFILRKPRGPSYLFDFRRINRRMHNKSLTVDGVATIVGGRNIGDEYFNAHADFQFADMDVLAVGDVVPKVAKSFDEYWNSKSAYPLEDIVTGDGLAKRTALRQALEDLAESDLAKSYNSSLKDTPLVSSGNVVDFDWVPVELVVDDPAKGLGDIPRRKLLITSLEKRFGEVKEAIDVATAYFVPGRSGANFLGRRARAGTKVRVLTNSLASNDVIPVHAGYARYRKRLLRHGVSLHELRASQGEASKKPRRKGRLPRFGASSSSLHAKIFVLDQKRSFIGSLNFDPRSLYLNCEMGLVIESAKLGNRISRQMTELIAARSYEPFLEPDGRLSWRDGAQQVHRIEPESNARQRTVAWLISWLPVEWLL